MPASVPQCRRERPRQGSDPRQSRVPPAGTKRRCASPDYRPATTRPAARPCRLRVGVSLRRRRTGAPAPQTEEDRAVSFYDLIGAGEQKGWDRQAKRLGGLQIDGKPARIAVVDTVGRCRDAHALLPEAVYFRVNLIVPWIFRARNTQP